MRAYYCILFLLILVLPFNNFGQISSGGYPLETQKLKSGRVSFIEMPAINNNQMLQKSVERYSEAEILKPFKFAESFDVNFTPDNSGEWLGEENGYNIWQLPVRSEGAYSINLIMEPFRLPPGARLFVFNREKTHVIGAFTEQNNKEFNSLALSPVAGDEIILQYEEPVNPQFKGELGVVKVNHDFAGILEDPNGRRPLGVSGSCNIDINCELASRWDSVKNSVCRIIVFGTEVCTGALINNTRKDKRPYVITANHCFSDYTNGEQNTIFLFNYESPYCGALDGDISNTISGSIKLAESDTLDFSLVELTEEPPPEYRPYYAGWDRSGDIADSVTAIHHPIGDIKKAAFDYNSPVIASFGTNSDYLENGFWKTQRWEFGTTEIGSSGSPYFDQNKRLIGTLTGGVASCSNPVNDFFERFDIAWDHYSDTTKQLKHWLDPIKTGEEMIDGLQGYEGELYCDAFTNLEEGDDPKLKSMLDQNSEFAGYWAGTNQLGVNEFVEKFSLPGDETIDGLSLGVARLIENSSATGSYISVNVYNGTSMPELLIYSKMVSVTQFSQGAMNFIPFDEIVSPSDTFFVGFDISHIDPNVTFAVYQTDRVAGSNSLFYKKNNTWFDFEQEMDRPASLAFEIIACNVKSHDNDTTNVINESEIKIYPNPSSTYINLLSNKELSANDIRIFDLLGKELSAKISSLSGAKEFRIVLPGARAGIYFVKVHNNQLSATQKFYYNAH